MKSPEQMGGSPEQPKVESMKDKEETSKKPERKITTPEEAAEMTRQRRKDFGLKEVRELTPEETEDIEGAIRELLDVLDQYDFKNYSPKRQQEWYWVEQEVGAGKDRELAKANLEKLLRVLEEEAEKTGK